MITRIVKLSLVPEKLAEFVTHFDAVKNNIRNFNGCTFLELLGEQNETGVVFTYSEWEQESDLQEYLHSKLFIDTWKKVKPLFSAKAEAWTVTSLRKVTKQ